MNHIKVELDFIPVEERLPDGDEPTEVWGLISGKGKPFNVEREEGGWFCGSRQVIITHWAEIPEL